MVEIGSYLAIGLIVLAFGYRLCWPRRSLTYTTELGVWSADNTAAHRPSKAVAKPVNVTAAKEMLVGSHQRIYNAYGEHLGKMDIFDTMHQIQARSAEHNADEAWRLARRLVVSTYGEAVYNQAMDELGFD